MFRRSLLTLLIAFALPNCAAPAARPTTETTVEVAPRQVESGFVGRWARRLDDCGIDQSREDAPLELHADGFDQYETHCSFDNLREREPGLFESRMHCSVQGDAQEGVIEFRLQGDGLTLNPGRFGIALVRCPAARPRHDRAVDAGPA